jgi:hypothetical protein
MARGREPGKIFWRAPGEPRAFATVEHPTTDDDYIDLMNLCNVVYHC